MSADIDDLLPSVADKCRKWEAACEAAGLSVRITSTWRSYAEQAAIYAQGRTKPGKIVTYARPGDSWHNHRRAFDFVILHNGRADWNDIKAFKKAQAIGRDFGLEGLSFELAHLQDRGGMTLAQAKARGAAQAKSTGVPADHSVKALQEALVVNGFKVVVDGVAGPKTKAAIVAFQKKAGLVADGVAGERTWAALLGKKEAA